MKAKESAHLLLIWIGWQSLVPFGSAKTCKIVKEVVRMRENFAFSGVMVRVYTLETRYEVCADNLPDCCRDAGCCDERRFKKFLILFVGVGVGMLFLIFTFACFYSAFCIRRNNGEKPIEAPPTMVEPKYNMDTYLTAAGIDPAALPKKGETRSAVQPQEYHGGDSDEEDDWEY